MYMLQAKDVYKKFHRTEVLKGISLEVAKGEVIAIIGPSGSGKSTFLRCLNRLETIDRGTIEIEGEIMVKNGFAKAYDKLYCTELPKYQELNLKAKTKKKGLYLQVDRF